MRINREMALDNIRHALSRVVVDWYSDYTQKFGQETTSLMADIDTTLLAIGDDVEIDLNTFDRYMICGRYFLQYPGELSGYLSKTLSGLAENFPHQFDEILVDLQWMTQRLLGSEKDSLPRDEKELRSLYAQLQNQLAVLNSARRR